MKRLASYPPSIYTPIWPDSIRLRDGLRLPAGLLLAFRAAGSSICRAFRRPVRGSLAYERRPHFESPSAFFLIRYKIR